MKNEYLFKGKIKGTSTGCKELDWAIGNLVVEQSTGRHYISDLSHFDDITKLHEVMIEVEPETVSRCVGICDKNGERMWENDVVHMRCNGLSGFGKVIYRDGCFWVDDKKRDRQYPFSNHDVVYRIDGNVFDNPELLGRL